MGGIFHTSAMLSLPVLGFGVAAAAVAAARFSISFAVSYESNWSSVFLSNSRRRRKINDELILITIH